MRIAINGMGRIGRLLFRRLVMMPGVELVAVNDIMELHQLAYLLRYDSVYGPATFEIAVENNELIAAGQTIRFLHEPAPAKLPWKALQVDLVLECTGKRHSVHYGCRRYSAQDLWIQSAPTEWR